MAAGFPVKANYVTGDVLTAANMNDLSGTVNLINPSAKGDLYAGSAANTYTKLSVGANDTVLTADSSTSTGLKWATPAVGMTQLATGTFSGATVNITSISADYKNLQLVLRNILPATDAAQMLIQFNANSSTVYAQRTFANANALTLGETSMTLPTMDNATSNSLMVLDLFDYANAVTFKLARHVGVFNNPTNPTTDFNYNTGQTIYASTSAITQINFSLSSGNFTSGTYILYGVK